MHIYKLTIDVPREVGVKISETESDNPLLSVTVHALVRPLEQLLLSFVCLGNKLHLPRAMSALVAMQPLLFFLYYYYHHQRRRNSN